MSSSDDEFTPKYKKSFGQNKKVKFNAFMVRKCDCLLEADKVMFKTRKFLPKFVLAPLHGFPNSKLDRLSIQQLECEMDSTGYPDDHKFFEIGYILVTLGTLTLRFFLTKHVHYYSRSFRKNTIPSLERLSKTSIFM